MLDKEYLTKSESVKWVPTSPPSEHPEPNHRLKELGIDDSIFCDAQVTILKEAASNITNDNIIKLMANTNFTSSQMKEILTGVYHGLTETEIRIYAEPIEGSIHYSAASMRQLRKAIENGLDEERVDLIANPLFTAGQRREIRLGFENRLTMNQVKVYASPAVNRIRMAEIRSRLESVSHGETPESIKCKIDYNGELGDILNDVRKLREALNSIETRLITLYEKGRSIK